MRVEKNRVGRNIVFKKKSEFSPTVRKRRRNVELNLLADFLANRMSAAGVSHVVKAPSAFRRTVWAIAILLTAGGMGTMTYRVLQEYLAYPTIMRSKTTGVKELEFPAVTICGTSSVPMLYSVPADLEYMNEMKSIVNNLSRYSISMEEKMKCLKDPLCYWSWFDDKCMCHENPCDTFYCYPDLDTSDDKCVCSMLLCLRNETAEGCERNAKDNGTTQCTCSRDFTYPLSMVPDYKIDECIMATEPRENCRGKGPDWMPEDFLAALKAVNVSEQIEKLWGHLKTSKTQDLRDKERFFYPSVSVMNDYGNPYDSVILSCSYGVENCWKFVTLYTPSYGKCYMFNYVGDEIRQKEDVKIVKQAGKHYGLQLFMRSRSSDFFPLLTRQLGVLLIIHDPRSIPNTDNGINLRPGDMTSINMEYTEIHRLGPPWGSCAEDGQKLGEYTRDPYDQDDCERDCVNREIFRRCNCYHSKYLRATVDPRMRNICSTNSNPSQDKCFMETMQDNDRGNIWCNCPSPCRQKSYETSISTSKLNEDFFRLVRTAKSLKMDNGTPAVTKGDFESSLMGVQIYYNDLFIAHINETAIYSWESLVANVGGNMGLFLGLSLVTVLEIIEFLFDMIYNAIERRKSQQQKVKDVLVAYNY